MILSIENLQCPQCSGSLSQVNEGLVCAECQRQFNRVNGVPYLLPNASEDLVLLESKDGEQMARNYGHSLPSRIVKTIRRIVTSEYFPGTGWRTSKAKVLGRSPILVIGSGVTRYPNAVHLDLEAFDGVDVVGDAHHLPFRDNTFDGLICEVVLEHVSDPGRVIKECHRVLKPGGICFFIVPFLFPFHGHPGDYRRWSLQGIKTEFSMFHIQETGIHGGPCSSIVNLITEWIYTLSGFTFPKAYNLIKGSTTAILFPIKFLDWIVNRFPEAHRMASTLYLYAEKRTPHV